MCMCVYVSSAVLYYKIAIHAALGPCELAPGWSVDSFQYCSKFKPTFMCRCVMRLSWPSPTSQMPVELLSDWNFKNQFGNDR